MTTLQFQSTPENILELIKELTLDEQQFLLSQLKKILGKSSRDKERGVDKKTTPGYYKGLSSLPPMESPDQLREKYALKREDLEPLIELFKDAPPAEELVKMLSK